MLPFSRFSLAMHGRGFLFLTYRLHFTSLIFFTSTTYPLHFRYLFYGIAGRQYCKTNYQSLVVVWLTNGVAPVQFSP